jgi:hypothetical protein
VRPPSPSGAALGSRHLRVVGGTSACPACTQSGSLTGSCAEWNSPATVIELTIRSIRIRIDTETLLLHEFISRYRDPIIARTMEKVTRHGRGNCWLDALKA